MRIYDLRFTIYALAIALCGFGARAGETGFSAAGTAISSNLSYTVVSAKGNAAGRGQPRIDYINATGDTAASKLTFYTVEAPVKITAAGVATNYVAATSALASFLTNNIVVLRHVASDTYQRLTVNTNTGSRITFQQNLSAAVVAGDLLYRATAGGTLAVAPVLSYYATTNELVVVVNYNREYAPANPLFHGSEGRPLLVEVNGVGTNTVALNLVSGTYQP